MQGRVPPGGEGAGRAFGINTTIPGEHPLMGHVTRTLVQQDGNWYVRTEGVGQGREGYLSTPRHHLNGIVGPSTFNNLDAMAEEYGRRRFGG
jgi:hypothetical protein